MTGEDIEHFEQALAARDGEYESESYEGHPWAGLFLRILPSTRHRPSGCSIR
jgi:hypothetical protein